MSFLKGNTNGTLFSTPRWTVLEGQNLSKSIWGGLIKGNTVNYNCVCCACLGAKVHEQQVSTAQSNRNNSKSLGCNLAVGIWKNYLYISAFMFSSCKGKNQSRIPLKVPLMCNRKAPPWAVKSLIDLQSGRSRRQSGPDSLLRFPYGFRNIEQHPLRQLKFMSVYFYTVCALRFAVLFKRFWEGP